MASKASSPTHTNVDKTKPNSNNSNNSPTEPNITTIEATDRLSVRVSTPVRDLFTAIQHGNNYSANGVMTHFLDLYIKYHGEASSTKLANFCKATIFDDDRLELITQFINDVNLTDVMNVSELTSKVSTLENEVTSLKEQIRKILNNQMMTSSNVSDNESKISHIEFQDFKITDGVGSLATSTVTTTPTFTLHEDSNANLYTLLAATFPSSITVFADRSINDLISHELGLPKTTYEHYVHNYAAIRDSGSYTTQTFDAIEKHIATFNKELILMLNTHCDNTMMCETFLPCNGGLLVNYLTARFSSIGKDNVFANIKPLDSSIWSLTLRELDNLISLLPKFKATHDFKLSSKTLNAPQSTMKSVLTQSYGFIFKAANSFNSF
jgi:hypothetical protein